MCVCVCVCECVCVCVVCACVRVCACVHACVRACTCSYIVQFAAHIPSASCCVVSVATIVPVQPYGCPALPRISNSTRVQVVVGDVSMTLQKALRQEVPVENFRHWMAPEAIKEKKFTEKSDVVSWDEWLPCSAHVLICILHMLRAGSESVLHLQ